MSIPNITKAAWLADPGRALDLAAEHGQCRVVDEAGAEVMLLDCQPLPEDEETARYRRALEEIRDSDHQAYPTHSQSLADHQYQIGVADGHRCAAEMARRALDPEDKP